MERDIIDRLMDFERCGSTPGERVNLRECAAIEIFKLRQEIARLQPSAWATYGGHVEFELLPDKPAPEARLEKLVKR